MAGKLRGRGPAELYLDTLIQKTQKTLNIACLSCQANIPGAQSSAHCPASDLGLDSCCGNAAACAPGCIQRNDVFCLWPGISCLLSVSGKWKLASLLACNSCIKIPDPIPMFWRHKFLLIFSWESNFTNLPISWSPSHLDFDFSKVQVLYGIIFFHEGSLYLWCQLFLLVFFLCIVFFFK